MLIKSLPFPSLQNNYLEVLLLMLLIVQIMMILRNESMKIKRQFRWDKYIIVKAAGCLGNYAATILVLGLTPSDSDCLQHNFLAAVL